MPAPASSFYRQTETGFLLYLRVTPNAGRDAVDGAETRDDGSTVLRIRVAAVPDRGRANVAVIGLVAKTLGLPRSSLTLVSGETGRFKTLAVVASLADHADALAVLAG